MWLRFLGFENSIVVDSVNGFGYIFKDVIVSFEIEVGLVGSQYSNTSVPENPSLNVPLDTVSKLGIVSNVYIAPFHPSP